MVSGACEVPRGTGIGGFGGSAGQGSGNCSGACSPRLVFPLCFFFLIGEK